MTQHAWDDDYVMQTKQRPAKHTETLQGKERKMKLNTWLVYNLSTP